MTDWRGRTIGPYVFQEQLGRGGMGVVWRACDRALERDVAIKVLAVELDADLLRENHQRLAVEAKAAAAIKSRHVAQILQLGTTDAGVYFVVMELLRGPTLLEIVRRERKLTVVRAVRIARQISLGMQAVHALGIIHRDLKPANVMLVREDREDEVVKVLDFGVAKRLLRSDDVQTNAQTVVGSLHFMAPEQLVHDQVGPGTDIWALGALLYRMIAGEAPFEGANPSELIQRISSSRPAPLGTRAAHVPDALNDVVMRCLEKDPADRFASMQDLEAALARAMVGPAPDTIVTSAFVALPVAPVMPRRVNVPAWATASIVVLASALAAWIPTRESAPAFDFEQSRLAAVLESAQPRHPTVTTVALRAQPAAPTPVRKTLVRKTKTPAAAAPVASDAVALLRETATGAIDAVVHLGETRRAR